jgi:superfamily II DNA or RNA helicase
MPTPKYNPGDSVTLPQVEKRVRGSTGRLLHVLRPSQAVNVKHTRSLKVSPRRMGTVLDLENGDAIVVTQRSKMARPSGVDGVLFVNDAGESRWLSHRLVDDFEERIARDGWPKTAAAITKSWQGAFAFAAEATDAIGKVVSRGLRPPQIGALHAIGSHWSLYKRPATVVMPTGTGKTETMLCVLTAYQPGLILVVVPSDILREQTARKFATLGLLRSLGNLTPVAQNPIVGVLQRRPKTTADLELLERCNVVVTTMSAIAEGTAENLIPEVASRVGALIVDEAHHIAAAGWRKFRDHFEERRVLQFTATPYRRDGRLVDGKVVYEYPLHLAQRDGYFKPIKFEPVYALNEDDGDAAIAKVATGALRADLTKGLDHLLMARCDRIERAKKVLDYYSNLAPDLKPVLVHSEAGDSTSALKQLTDRTSRIVVAVNMLGEGFDLPQLKIAAVHDTHKSLAVLLQFSGRFTRTAGSNIGDATVIANIADPNVSAALERLYSEDADWNRLLSELSSQATKSHAALMEFLNESERLGSLDEGNAVEISHHLLRPMFSTVMFECDSFTPKSFVDGVPRDMVVHQVWLHGASATLYFVTRSEPPLKWAKTRDLRDRQWHLFVVHHDPVQKLLFVSSSDKSSTHDGIGRAVGGTKLIAGDTIFRSLGRVNRLIFQNVGVRKYGRRNLRFAMYTGADVAEALSISEKGGSVKSNVSGTGWENGAFVTIGCSYKGRVWTREPGSIPQLNRWCEAVGSKILDASIDTKDIIKNVLIPKEVTALPDKSILSVEWPVEILGQMEERVVLKRGTEELPISVFDLELVSAIPAKSQVNLEVRSAAEPVWTNLTFSVGGPNGFTVTETAALPVSIRIGRLEASIADYLTSYPPYVRFVDLTELDGNILFEPDAVVQTEFPADRFEVWDWTGTDLTKESIWKNGAARYDSIQYKAAQHYISGQFDVVFDDDASGEAADLVCLNEGPDFIRLVLAHCKFTKGATAGERIKDVQEVCAQASRSAKWSGRFRDLCRHILEREKRFASAARPTRFLRGDVSAINGAAKASRFKEVRLEVVIVQPGLSMANHTKEQAIVLGAADSYLRQTVDAELDVIASA